MSTTKKRSISPSPTPHFAPKRRTLELELEDKELEDRGNDVITSKRVGIASPSSANVRLANAKDGNHRNENFHSNVSPGKTRGPKKRVSRISEIVIDRRFRNLRMAVYQSRMRKWNAAFEEQLQDLRHSNSKNAVKKAQMLCEDYLLFEKLMGDTLIPKPGIVYNFGCGDCMQLGHGNPDIMSEENDCLDDKDVTVLRPRVVKSLKQQQQSNGNGVLSIACGGQHNAVLLQDGSVWTFGCNDDMSLGRSPPAYLSFLPGRVDFNNDKLFDPTKDGVVAVDTGATQTLALTLRGHVYMWGCYKDDGKQFCDPSGNDSNATSNNDANSSSRIRGAHASPVLVDGLSKVIQIACGDAHNAAIKDDGTLYTWGIGAVGNLSRRVPNSKKDEIGEDECPYDIEIIQKYHLTPHPVEWFGGIKHKVRFVACGAYHIVAIAAGSGLFTAGLNNYGQLGHGDTEHRECLTRVRALSGKVMTGCDAGNFHTICHDTLEVIYTFGRNDSSQLGISEETAAAGSYESLPQVVTLPGAPTDSKIHSVCAGDNHTMALLSTGKVYSWGYGEMAQLGHGREKDECLPRLIKMDDSVKVTKISGGGQHSGFVAYSVVS